MNKFYKKLAVFLSLLTLTLAPPLLSDEILLQEHQENNFDPLTTYPPDLITKKISFAELFYFAAPDGKKTSFLFTMPKKYRWNISDSYHFALIRSITGNQIEPKPIPFECFTSKEKSSYFIFLEANEHIILKSYQNSDLSEILDDEISQLHEFYDVDDFKNERRYCRNTILGTPQVTITGDVHHWESSTYEGDLIIDPKIRELLVIKAFQLCHEVYLITLGVKYHIDIPTEEKEKLIKEKLQLLETCVHFKKHNDTFDPEKDYEDEMDSVLDSLNYDLYTTSN